MNSNTVLVGSIVDRIASRLPYRTGSTDRAFEEDKILQITRATLVDLSKTDFDAVLTSLLGLLEDLGRPFACVSAHPPYVLESELYILSLAAASCNANWQWSVHKYEETQDLPGPLDPLLVKRILQALNQLLEPIPDDYILPAYTLLDQLPERNFCVPRSGCTSSTDYNEQSSEGAECLGNCLVEFDAYIKVIVEFISASNWSAAFEHVKNTIYSIRTTPFPDGEPESHSRQEGETAALVTLRLLSFFWVDSLKLGLIIQEICSSYLHFRRPYQSAIAIVLPLLVTRWLDRFPYEFVRLHSGHKRLDGGCDTLFDMTHIGADNGRRRAVVYPLQITLLLLLPDVFEVASNLREAKSNNLIKKVSFLNSLRKALRNGNDRAAYCLVALLRAARHFEAESDSALVSYAMDVHDEIRDSVFCLSLPGNSAPTFGQDMITVAFVSLAHLDPDGGVGMLTKTCVSSSTPSSYKTAIIQACSYFVGQPRTERYTELHDHALSFIQSEFETECTTSSSFKGELSSSSERKVLEILRYLDIYSTPLIHDLLGQNPSIPLLRPFLFSILSRNSSVCRFAGKVARKLFAGDGLALEMRLGKPELSVDIRTQLWDHISLVSLGLCADVKDDLGMLTLTRLREFLIAKSILLKGIPVLSNVPTDATSAVQEASLELESTLLVSLCSPTVSVCQTATFCVGLVVGECALAGVYSDSAKFLSSNYRNNLIYQELSSSTFHFTGLVAFQKRFRGLLRQMRIPTRGILDAWKFALERWMRLSKDVSVATADSIDDRLLSEWRNFSGFLASSGGICTHDHAIRLDEAFEDLQWIDRLFPEQHEEPLLTRFLRLGIQLLGCENIKVREATREVLSTEVSSILYPALFQALELELEVLFAGVLASLDQSQEKELIFADQAASLLKAMVEKLESPLDFGSVSSVHLAALTLGFAKFLDGAPDRITTLRLRIKVCNLYEAVIKRREHLNLRDDVRIRNQLLEHIFGWIARPYALTQGRYSNAGSRPEELRRVQKDLDKACLKTLADLTLRLPLQPTDNQTDAGTSELKSQMFHTYFNRFLSLLNHETQETNNRDFPYGGSNRDGTLSNADLVIKILSNLLSANIDVGLKHSLNIGYHENVEIRAAFVRVLCNILTQGTEFSSLTDSTVNDRYVELLDRGLIFDLFEALIRQEIEQTENETEILRRTCVATRMLSVYAKWKGASYLKSTLQKVLERLMLTSQDLDLELDPARVAAPEELQKNAAQLQIVAKVFMDDICASVMDVPSSFRRICSIISNAVLPRFPNAKYTAVGAFVFLRFFCPAIVTPETDHLVSASPTKEMRRGLLLIAKIIQNLANNVLFGTKEPYMFPLNPFLVQNIHIVTGFLREISVPLQQDVETTRENIVDFGSCVSLHRFLYDHWDHLRQTLISKEKKEHHRLPGESVRVVLPVLEPLRRLITNLGPPPLAISWNRPNITGNTPPLYSRFQNFMLRNAFRSAESFLTSRAVYDGGESKDGLSFICVILRHIENEAIDYDTLLYCYLKIASRLWHKPFGLLIDATCYNGRIEPADDFFSKLDLLTPTELARNLSRIYIYNMNSVFKRCFRRLLRSSTRDDSSVFHPGNVEYHMFGSLSDLQIPFYLQQLHLPQETMSVATETRFMFKSITRLSRSKGKVDVVIRVGSQFVQITTVKKQEVLSGVRISSIINDIFRLSDIDEATTSVTLQSDDDSGFGLRADGGKIVMFFSSSHREDILQTIRGAKAKLGKDNRFLKPAERLVRPQDVPGTMLNLALTNLSSPYHVLRLASYNLLGALCRSFDFSSAGRLVCNKDLAVPLDPTRFIVSISRELAQTEPQLASDFLAEFFVSWESIPDEQKPVSLEYVAPWLSSLRSTVLVADIDGEKGREKVATLFRKLIEVAVLDQSLTYVLERSIWPSISQDELLLDIFIDELIKVGLGYGNQPETLEILCSVMTGLGTITLRGRIICRLRKALNRSSLRPTRQLPDNLVWEEVCVLLQFCLALSFDSRVQSQMFLPEILHLITMLANTGGCQVRSLVYKLLINSIHSVCASFRLDDMRASRLRSIMDVFANSNGEIFLPPPPLARDGASVSTSQESSHALTTTERLMEILHEVCSIAAPSVDVANAWRARWMSLVASTAFQNNPAIQPRAFTVMGYLAKEEVDDDLLYQVLVALRNSVSQYGEDGNSEMLVSIITSLTKLMPKLASASRYGLQLFWLAISLVRLVPANLFNFAAQFLDAVLKHISIIRNVKGDRMVPLLMQSRTQLEEAALSLDNAYGVHFEQDTFHFAVCACLVRGLADTLTRATTIQVLLTFLGMMSFSGMHPSLSSEQNVCQSPYLALLLARGTSEDDFIDSLWWSDIKCEGVSTDFGVRRLQSIEHTTDRDLFLISVIELVDFHCLDDAVQARGLRWLNLLGQKRANVFTSLCGVISSILDDVLLHSQDIGVLEAAHTLLRTISSQQKYLEELGSQHSFSKVLDEIGFSGLYKGSSHSITEDIMRDCFELIEKLIELIVL
ncbi:hypothetical protein E4U42_003545 [Claviceps africana]|uniref:Ras-GAP domain-containing protein n=1 Tax=Claviceps africana TaxID=83212 RepID=A0A8K0JDP9_9HYPO|nr:hypothetical protein E4U42_003545 [Claviceps africana]